MFIKLSFFILLYIFIIGTQTLSALAKYEPVTGCYLGAYIESDSIVPGDITTFETNVQKEHACYMIYAGWNSGFPSAWAQNVKSQGGAVQIAFEPSFGLDSVTDGHYIRKWAQDAHTLRMPVFVRWASEMNLSEFIWSGDTQKYIDKWRLLYNIFQEEAPNIAMVWAPNWSPTYNIDSYYPGDEYVDWVGVDIYMGLGTGTTDQNDPRTKISYVYNTYSAGSHNKPIMLPEWAACHAYDDGIVSYDCTSYGIEKMNLIYDHIQAEFPKIKLINWFDWDTRNINHADFSLTNNFTIQTNYRRTISNPYYISDIPYNTSHMEIFFSNITPNQVISTSLFINATTTPGFEISTVTFHINNTLISVSTAIPHQFYWSVDTLNDGYFQMKVKAYTIGGDYEYDQIDLILDKDGDYTNIIIDNDQPGFTTSGSGWILSSSQGDRYGSNYRYHFSGTGSATAYWRPTMTHSGIYEVYAWWSIHPNRATNTPFSIHYYNGSTTLFINQEINGGQWNYLGNYYFSIGTTGYVSISDNADDIVIADAIRFTKNSNSLDIIHWYLY